MPAIMGSAFGAAGQRCLAGSVCVVVGDDARRAEVREALVAAASELTVGPATTRPPTSARWSPRQRARRSPRRSAEQQMTVPSCCWTAAATPGRPARCSGRRSRVAEPESELARDELFGPLLTVVEVDDLDAAHRVPQRLALRQRRRDLHRSGEAARALPLRRRGGNARRQRRRPRAGRLVPVRRLEGLDATATCTPTARTLSTSTRERRSSPVAGSRGGCPSPEAL